MKMIQFLEALELTLSLYSARRNLGPPKSHFLQCDVSVYGTVQEPIVGSAQEPTHVLLTLMFLCMELCKNTL